MNVDHTDRSAAVPAGPSAGTERSYFEALYRERADPWDFDSSWYEQRKYALTLDALPRPRYHRALEPGCANGALSVRLAERCDELFAFDFIDDAVERTRDRLADRHNVRVLSASFPHYWPYGVGDLVVWSEVAYYLTDVGWDIAIQGLERWLEPGGTLIAVHYTGETDYPLRGAEVGRRLDATDFLARTVAHHDEWFELGVWKRRLCEPPLSPHLRDSDV